jgi:hypothetical protein
MRSSWIIARNFSSSFGGSGELELVPVAGEYMSFDAFDDVFFFTVVGFDFGVTELIGAVDAFGAAPIVDVLVAVAVVFAV